MSTRRYFGILFRAKIDLSIVQLKSFMESKSRMKDAQASLNPVTNGAKQFSPHSELPLRVDSSSKYSRVRNIRIMYSETLPHCRY